MWERLIFEDRSARSIAATVARAIRVGDLEVGERLPPVRAIAKTLGVSPTTVSEAWQELARTGAIETHGRNGTIVRQHDAVLAPRRYRQVASGGSGGSAGSRGSAGSGSSAGSGGSAFEYNLSTGTPDPRLLPDLGRAILAAHDRAEATTRPTYGDRPVLEGLEEILRGRWPFPPGSITVVNGAMDALDCTLRSVIRLGDRVIVENPTFPPLLDLLDVLGAEVVPVAMDARGLDPERLRVALAASRPRACIYQPRAQNPTGASLDSERVQELAEVLAAHPDVILIEDDHSGDIATAPCVSLGTHLPDRTVTILGFSKSHGPDLRIAAVGGARSIVDSAATRRQLGPGWTSRLLQAALLHMLVDPDTIELVTHARSAYAERRSLFVDALRTRGVTVSGRDGINCWVNVDEEQHGLVHCAARGIAVAPGAPFSVGEHEAHLRVTISEMADSIDHIADSIAQAARQQLAPPGV